MLNIYRVGQERGSEPPSPAPAAGTAAAADRVDGRFRPGGGHLRSGRDGQGRAEEAPAQAEDALYVAAVAGARGHVHSQSLSGHEHERGDCYVDEPHRAPRSSEYTFYLKLILKPKIVIGMSDTPDSRILNAH